MYAIEGINARAKRTGVPHYDLLGRMPDLTTMVSSYAPISVYDNAAKVKLGCRTFRGRNLGRARDHGIGALRDQAPYTLPSTTPTTRVVRSFMVFPADCGPRGELAAGFPPASMRKSRPRSCAAAVFTRHISRPRRGLGV